MIALEKLEKNSMQITAKLCTEAKKLYGSINMPTLANGKWTNAVTFTFAKKDCGKHSVMARLDFVDKNDKNQWVAMFV